MTHRPTLAACRLLRFVGRVLVFAACVASVRAAPVTREYDLKAVFLYNFAMFVEWPKEARPPPGKPLVIGILGRDPFGRVLEDVVAGEVLGGNSLAVRRYTTPEAAAECHILYISESETPHLPQILAFLHGKPVLTVADMAHFAESGAIITFSTGTRVQLHINKAAAEAAGLNISSKLLRVAIMVEPSSPP